MTLTQARAAMLDLDLLYLQRVRVQASASNAFLIGLALATITEDGQVTQDEALQMAALIYLLSAIERHGEALGRVTMQSAVAVLPLAYREGGRQAAQIIGETFPGTSVSLPFRTLGQLMAGNAIKTNVLAAFGTDAVELFKRKLATALETMGLRDAVTHSISDTFAAGNDVRGQMARRAMIVVRQSNFDTFRPAMTELYRLSLENGLWVWRARLDGNTCAACVALSGRVFPVSRPFEHAHTGCRCMPELIRDASQIGETGDDWLRAQPAAVQRGILGVKGAELYRAGAVQLRDFLRLQRHPVYGPTWRDGGVGWAEQKAARRAA